MVGLSAKAMLTLPPRVSLSSRTGVPPSRPPPLKVLLSSQAGGTSLMVSTFPFFQKPLILHAVGSRLHTAPGSHFPVPSACWERVWVSLLLMLRVPNKASRRSHCFLFLNLWSYSALISKVRTEGWRCEVRSCSSREQAYLARVALTIFPAIGRPRKDGRMGTASPAAKSL